MRRAGKFGFSNGGGLDVPWVNGGCDDGMTMKRKEKMRKVRCINSCATTTLMVGGLRVGVCGGGVAFAVYHRFLHLGVRETVVGASWVGSDSYITHRQLWLKKKHTHGLGQAYARAFSISNGGLVETRGEYLYIIASSLRGVTQTRYKNDPYY
jgi:hypothetical protein